MKLQFNRYDDGLVQLVEGQHEAIVPEDVAFSVLKQYMHEHWSPVMAKTAYRMARVSWANNVAFYLNGE